MPNTRPEYCFISSLMIWAMAMWDVYNPHSKNPHARIWIDWRVRGMRFTDAHSPSAVCTPTRYGILTGRLLLAHRIEEPCVVQLRMAID